jgi:hypothetical protein
LCRYTPAAWNGVAKAHARSNDPLTCIPWLRKMEQDDEGSVKPSQCTYNIALTAGLYKFANPVDP